MIECDAALASADPASVGPGGTLVDVADVQAFVFGVLFIFGGITSLTDILFPKLKALFTFSDAVAILLQSAYSARTC